MATPGEGCSFGWLVHVPPCLMSLGWVAPLPCSFGSEAFGRMSNGSEAGRASVLRALNRQRVRDATVEVSASVPCGCGWTCWRRRRFILCSWLTFTHSHASDSHGVHFVLGVVNAIWFQMASESQGGSVPTEHFMLHEYVRRRNIYVSWR